MAKAPTDYDAEFALLDVGATSSLLRAGSLRPTVMAFLPTGAVDSMVLDWTEAEGSAAVFENARRHLRTISARGYAVAACLSEADGALTVRQPGDAPKSGDESLALLLVSSDGEERSVRYPIRRHGASVSLGMAAQDDGRRWCPIGDVWGNPYCVGDLVRFGPRERAVDPSTPLWKSLVEVTRQRIQDDQPRAADYMTFLDDLRNGILVVAGRSPDAPMSLLLRPRTVFNPIGLLEVEASKVLLLDAPDAQTERVVAE